MLLASLCLLAFYVGYRWYFKTFSSPLPPGPSGLPLLGNAFQIPKGSYPWVTYSVMGQKYGRGSGLLFLRIFRRQILVLNTLKAATDLLDNRSSIYSDRPSSVMSGELVDRKNSVFFVSYSSYRFRAYRTVLQSGLNIRACETYLPLQTEEAYKLLHGLLQAPNNFRALIRRNTAAVIMKLAFGYSVESDDDPFVELADTRIRISEQAAQPGWLVDSFPILKYLPSWFPGAKFKRTAERWRKEVADLQKAPFEYVKKQLATGTAYPSFTSRQLEPTTGKNPTEVEEDVIMWVAGGLYAAGTDTTTGYLAIFFCVMAIFPEMQQRAQQELDSLLKHRRLPTMNDKDDLPFVNSLIKEIHRWAPVGPLALPHKVTQDDEYQGYFIPQGTTVITNRWAMLHDPTVYSEPLQFNPDRFLNSPDHKAEPDPEVMIFGFGRRACPGVHFANASIFINVACILAAFSIGKPENKTGKEYTPNLEFATGIVAHPLPFDCTITPRSKSAISLIEDNINT